MGAGECETYLVFSVHFTEDHDLDFKGKLEEGPGDDGVVFELSLLAESEIFRFKPTVFGTKSSFQLLW